VDCIPFVLNLLLLVVVVVCIWVGVGAACLLLVTTELLIHLGGATYEQYLPVLSWVMGVCKETLPFNGLLGWNVI
jgi:hypothetical protein